MQELKESANKPPLSEENIRGLHSHLLLLHQLGIGAVVYHISTENRSSQWAVDFFCRYILPFAIQNEIVSLCSKNHGSASAKENEGKGIAILFHMLDRHELKEGARNIDAWECARES